LRDALGKEDLDLVTVGFEPSEAVAVDEDPQAA
jgi:hypothetical protein